MPQSKPPSTSDAQPTFGLRFSLATMLMLLLIASLIGSNLFTSWHLQNARQTVVEQKSLLVAKDEEIRIYRNQLGLLYVQDPTMVHVLERHNNKPGDWSWRVYVPDGAQFTLYATVGGIPMEGVCFPGLGVHVAPGETTLNVKLDRVSNTGGAMSATSNQVSSDGASSSGSASSEWSGGETRWFPGDVESTAVMLCPDWHQVKLPGIERAVLIRERQWPMSDTFDPPDKSQPSAGILIWLEPSIDGKDFMDDYFDSLEEQDTFDEDDSPSDRS